MLHAGWKTLSATHSNPVGPSPRGFLYVTIFEVIFLWDLAEQGPTPKDIQCLKNWGRNFNEICENSDTVKKPWKGHEKPVKTLWKTRKIRFVQKMQKEWCCDFVTNFSHECSRSMWLLLIYVKDTPSHSGNSQTCCMQDERLCLPLIPSFDVPLHKKGLKHVLVRLLWHGFTEAHDHVSPFCLEYRHLAWCQVCDELKTCTTLQGCVCGWHKGCRRLAHLALVKQHETTAKLAMFQEQR